MDIPRGIDSTVLDEVTMGQNILDESFTEQGRQETFTFGSSLVVCLFYSYFMP